MQKKDEQLLVKILDEMKVNPKITEVILAKKLNYSERTIRRYIKILKDNNKIILLNYGRDKEWKILI